MQRQTRIFIILAILPIITSCVSKPVKLGDYNPVGLPENDLVTLHVFNYVNIQKVNNEKVDWPQNSMKERIVRIPVGENTFWVTANNGRLYTFIPMTVAALFEKGNTYYLRYKMNLGRNGSGFSFHIFLYNDNRMGKEVTLDFAGIRRDDSSVISRYIKYVLNPRIAEVGFITLFPFQEEAVIMTDTR